MRLLHVRRKALPSRLAWLRDSSEAASAEPTVGSPAAAAIPSSRVDFPEPFSPTKKVTDESGVVVMVRIAGTPKGNEPSSGGWPFLQPMARR